MGIVLFDIRNPVQNSILVFILLIIIYLGFFQKKYEDKIKNRPYLLPVVVITLAIVIFYIFKMIELHYS